MKQAYQLKGSARTRQITFQYEPIDNTLVLIVMERVNSSKKQERWIIQQIAGPWGNTSIKLKDTHTKELKAAQDEARNLTRYLEADLGFENYWKAQII
jgi:hypothetical protein